MMKLQGLIVTTRSLFGGHRSMFGFVVLPFVGVVLFPSPAICWSCVVPLSSKLLELCCSLVLPFDGVGLRNTFGGGDMLNVLSLVSYVIPLPPLFSFSSSTFLFLVVFALSGCCRL